MYHINNNVVSTVGSNIESAYQLLHSYTQILHTYIRISIAQCVQLALSCTITQNETIVKIHNYSLYCRNKCERNYNMLNCELTRHLLYYMIDVSQVTISVVSTVEEASTPVIWSSSSSSQ